jgi:hypothetical protein
MPAADLAYVQRQRRLQNRPLHVGQVVPPRHRYSGHLAAYRSATRRDFLNLTIADFDTSPRLCLLDHGLGRSGFARSQMKMSAICTVARYLHPSLS